ncbi:DNA adenine methylase [Macrococcus hajekii]|uniref:site-specific DNA-methyltransferase (adenine-specific) n=1 Tax=Macrococcus hajekii TaxID=198482 RepID=A0A4R6BJI2_9STAP|nr:DNA adenine methylase [Macrococcus hajekii]TDM01798.1 DNA adenine methylase [Macrococcus hajekii]GGB07570.1 methylase [Macrococcus hajekii]
MNNYSPLRYPGGKVKTYGFIKSLIELNGCNHYIEPYAGGAGVAIKLLLNNDVKKITINDYDKSIYAFWYCVFNNTDSFIKLIEETPVTIDEWYKQKEVQKKKLDSELDLLQLGFSTLFLNRTNRSGIIKAGVIGGKKQDGNYLIDCRFNKESIIDKIYKISKYSSSVVLTNKDAKDFINQNIMKTKNSFTFFDPPYYQKGPSLYTNFYIHENHLELSNLIKTKMKKRLWILTYDISPNIFQMYGEEYRSIKYNLNYSIAKPSMGEEYMFFSQELNLRESDIFNYLNVIDNQKIKNEFKIHELEKININMV